MPIKPNPWVYKCPACSWKKLISPNSDVLSANEYYDCCPKCKASPLLKERINNPLQFLIASLTDFL